MNRWIRPSCDSRTGASHRRRGAPCQDASGVVGCLDAAGTPIQVLVVSDGHGGARYGRSDVGARLACTVAMRELQQAVAAARVAFPGALEEWRGRLAEELPARIVAAWRREVERHWRATPGAEGAGFSPVLYGATLGVLVLTPHWWAHTGLGDWDLVRIEADGAEGAAGEMAGGEALVSEEPECEGGGEATFSLCLEGAERHFAPRTALYPLTPEVPPFALLLGTDGLRKSCGSDADFLTLCRYLAGLCPSAEPDRDPAGSDDLAEALDHISRQGSGDDISVAVARWAPAGQAPAWPQPGHQEPAQVVQPSPGPASVPHAAEMAAATGAALATATDDGAPASQGLADPSLPFSTAAAGAGRRRVGPAAGRALSRRGRRPSSLRLVLLAAGLAGGSGVLLFALGRGLGPFAARPQPLPLGLTPQQRSDLRRQVQDLCEAPGARAAAPLRAGVVASRPMQPDRAEAPPAAPPSGAPADAAPQARASSVAALPVQGSPATPAMRSGQIAVPAPDPRRQQRIAATLATRASVFRSLRDGDPAQLASLLEASHADPLSALIAASASDASLRPAASAADPPGPLQQLGRRLAALAPGPMSSRHRAAVAAPLAELGACPELRQALRGSWQRLQAGDDAWQAVPRSPSSGAPPVRGQDARGGLPGPSPGVSGPSAGSAASSP